jgi:hypothetical protein
MDQLDDRLGRLAEACPDDVSWPADTLQVDVLVQAAPGSEGTSHRYHLAIGPDGIRAHPGAAEHADAALAVDAATASEIRSGDQRARRAFLEGRLRIVAGGDVVVRLATLLAALARADDGTEHPGDR